MFGGVNTGAKVVLNHRNSLRVKTGLKVKPPQGYRLAMCAHPTFAEKGLLVVNSLDDVDQDGNLSVLVLNCGRELVEVKDGDKIATCWLEMIFRPDWINVPDDTASQN